MNAILTKTISKHTKLLSSFVLGASIMAWMYIALFPAMKEKTEVLKGMLDAFPPALIEAFGIEAGSFFSTLESMMAMYHFSVILPFMIIAFVIAIASSAIAGEIEQRTMSLLLMQPVSRTAIYMSKYLAGLLIVSLFVLLGVFVIIPLATVYNIDYVGESYVYAFVTTLLFAIAFYSFAFMMSAFSNNKSRVMGSTLIVAITMYSLFLFSSLNESVEFLKFVSYFYYYDYKNALLDQSLDAAKLLIPVLTSVIFVVVGWWQFNRKDMSV